MSDTFTRRDLAYKNRREARGLPRGGLHHGGAISNLSEHQRNWWETLSNGERHFIFNKWLGTNWSRSDGKGTPTIHRRTQLLHWSKKKGRNLFWYQLPSKMISSRFFQLICIGMNRGLNPSQAAQLNRIQADRISVPWYDYYYFVMVQLPGKLRIVSSEVNIPFDGGEQKL